MLVHVMNALKALRRLPATYPRLFTPRILIPAAAAILLIVLTVILTRGDSDRENAYSWSRICVRKVIANPKAAEFPPFPGDDVDVTKDERNGVFTVRAEVTTESMAGLRVRHTFVAELKHHRWRNEWELVRLDID
jgi:hypothetical protein